jgi:pyruvate/2-oxoglutarate/acetoin dehydrogenase E1 component
VRRVAYPDRPSPYVKSLERVLLPGKEKVLEAARDVLAW